MSYIPIEVLDQLLEEGIINQEEYNDHLDDQISRAKDDLLLD